MREKIYSAPWKPEEHRETKKELKTSNKNGNIPMVAPRTVFCKIKDKTMSGVKAHEVYLEVSKDKKESICALQCSHQCFIN